MDDEVERYNTGVTERNASYMNFLNGNDQVTEVGNTRASIQENHNISNSNHNSIPRIAVELENAQIINSNNSVPVIEEVDVNNSYDMYEQQRIPEVEENFSEYLEMQVT